MRSKRSFRWTTPVASLAALCIAVPALGAAHSTPLSASPKRFYPSGSNISQTYVQPAASEVGLMDASAVDGHVSSAAAMSNLLSQPMTGNRAAKQLTHVLKTQTRIGLGRANAPGLASTPALYKFSYGFQYKDVPLWKYSSQSQLIHVKGKTRKTLFLRERNIPNLDQLGATEATVPPEAATRAGLDDCKDATKSPLAVDAQNDVPRREIHVDANGKATLAWAFVVRSTDRAQPFARRYWVAARGAPQVLVKEDLIFHAGQDAAAGQGRVTGNFLALRKSPLDPPAKGQGLNDYTPDVARPEVDTDANGFYSILPGAGPINTQLLGPSCKIINDGGALLTPTRTGNNLFFNAATEQELAQVSAFKWVSTAHSFVKDLLPTNPTRLMNLPTHVNIDETCNAFFDPSEHTLNFFKAGDDCMNTAYCDVVCHEFGHAVDDQFGEILDGGYSEGFGDSLAILITRDSIIGRDFQGKGTSLRDARKIFPWPPPDPEVHEVGRIYGGFAWELTQLLTSKLGSEDKGFEAARQLILGAAALNPKDTPDAVRLSFLVDRQNGSPFFQELAAAADSRKIPRPESPEALDNPRLLSAGNAR